MAVELINVGQIANDGTGDDLREAFIKINQNFEELDLRDDERTTASNIGASGEGIFAQKINYDLQFKNLVPGTDITLVANDNQILINANGGLKTLLVTTDAGSKILKDTDGLNIFGGTGINTRLVGDTLTIENISSKLSTDLTPQLSSTLDAQDNSILNVNNLTAVNVQSLVHGIDIRNIQSQINKFDVQFDFGDLTQEATSILEWIILGTEIDFGSFTNPDNRNVELGQIS